MATSSRALGALTGSDGHAMVRRVLSTLGRPSPSLIEISKVHHRPGIDTTVAFNTRVAGRPDVTLVLLTDADVQGRVVRVESGGLVFWGWMHPDDPRLESLRSATEPDGVRRWLWQAHISGEPVSSELMSYRPLRRAVLRVRAGERTAYLKIVRPDRAEPLVARHLMLDAAGVGPHVLATPQPGVLLLDDVRGRTLAQALVDWQEGASELPEPEEVLRLLDRLPQGLMRFRRRDSWSDRVDFHGSAAASALPGHAGEIDRIGAHVRRLMEASPAGPDVPTHGDFYEANVFVSGRHFTHLIDVDTAGPGRRVDDLACLLGHLAVLPDLSPTHYAHVAQVTYAWASVFERVVDPVALRARVAGVILSLVAGTTHPHGLARLDLCRSWLYRAGDV